MSQEERDPPTQRGIATEGVDEDDILAFLQDNTDRTVTIEELAHRTGLQRTEVRVRLEHLAAQEAVEITPRLHEVAVTATDHPRPDGGIERLPRIELSLDALLDTISAERRRKAIRVLAALEEDEAFYLSVTELAEEVADSAEEPTRDVHVDGVYATLKTNHVPRLADYGLVDYRPFGRGSTVAPTDQLEDVAQLLESLDSVVDAGAPEDADDGR